eukprot:15072731-Alexandrium_andersonii.AAC.1
MQGLRARLHGTHWQGGTGVCVGSSERLAPLRLACCFCFQRPDAPQSAPGPCGEGYCKLGAPSGL